MNGYILLNSKIGTPIYSKAFVQNYGLPTKPGIGKSMILLIGNLSFPDNISSVSLSGVLFSLKVNAQLVKDVEQNDSCLTHFRFNDVELYFYTHPTVDVMCVVFVNSSLRHGNFNVGEYIAEQLCLSFVQKYKKILVESNRTVRRRFKSFNVELNLLLKNVALKLLKEGIELINVRNYIHSNLILCVEQL